MENELLTWEQLDINQRGDVEFLVNLHKQYEASGYTHKTNREMMTIAGHLKLLEIELQKELTKDVKKKGEEEELSEFQKEIKRILDEEELYYVLDENMFYQWSPDKHDWIKTRSEGIKIYYGLGVSIKQSMFIDEMRHRGRMYESAEYTFNAPPTTLNLLKTDHWLTPIEHTELNPWFDLLLHALGKGERAVMDHLEQLIWYKYSHPEDYEIPCPIIYGEGGIGKNKYFVQGLLATIFGHHQVITTRYASIGGQFNTNAKGKLVVFIDEATSSKTDANVLKSIVGNERININEKNITEKNCRNTAWYITGGNDITGAVLLDGSSTDRRWSIIKIPPNKGIIWWLMERRHIEDFEEARMLLVENEHVYRDPEEVAKFLGYLQHKWGEITRPDALHGEDYYNLINLQKDEFKCFCDWVFDDAFTWLSGRRLYELYQAYTKTYGSAFSQRTTKGRNKFLESVKAYLHDSDIRFMKVHYRGKTTTAFIRNPGTEKFKDVDQKECINRYLEGDSIDFEPERWLLKEVPDNAKEEQEAEDWLDAYRKEHWIGYRSSRELEKEIRNKMNLKKERSSESEGQ